MLFFKFLLIQVRLKDAVNNFFTSPAWEDMKNTTAQINHILWTKGFGPAWEELVIALDPEGETNAYRVNKFIS